MARRKTTRRKTAKRRTTRRKTTRRASRRTTKKTPLAKWLFILGLIAMLLSFMNVYSASIGIAAALILWLLAGLMKK